MTGMTHATSLKMVAKIERAVRRGFTSTTTLSSSPPAMHARGAPVWWEVGSSPRRLRVARECRSAEESADN